jgi:hypothetical protein
MPNLLIALAAADAIAAAFVCGMLLMHRKGA